MKSNRPTALGRGSGDLVRNRAVRTNVNTLNAGFNPGRVLQCKKASEYLDLIYGMIKLGAAK